MPSSSKCGARHAEATLWTTSLTVSAVAPRVPFAHWSIGRVLPPYVTSKAVAMFCFSHFTSSRRYPSALDWNVAFDAPEAFPARSRAAAYFASGSENSSFSPLRRKKTSSGCFSSLNLGVSYGRRKYR